MARLDLAALLAEEENEEHTSAVDETAVTETPPAPERKPVEPKRPAVKKPAAKPKPAAEPQVTAAAEPVTEPAAPASQSDHTESDANKTVGVPVHLPDDIQARLIAWMDFTGRSHPVVMLDALETVYDDLEELIQKRLGPDDRPKTVLFERTNRQAPKTTAHENPHKHTVRIAKKHRDVLDKLTVDRAAPSRNFLLIAAYDGYLPSLEKIAEMRRQRDEEAAKNQKENG